MAQPPSTPAAEGGARAVATPPSSPPAERPPPQVVKFTFYQLDPAWRRLGEEEKRRHREAFAATLDKFRDSLILHTYSTVATRGDCDLVLWAVGERVEDVQALHAALNRTPMAGWLRVAHSFLSLTRRSQYIRGHEHAGGHGGEARVVPGEGKYLVVYPFWKTHAWYQLPFEERRAMMGEHFRIGHKYPHIRIHTTYAFGLDDPEFVLAFETDDLDSFLHMVEELRGAKQRPYTLRDTPILTAVKAPLPEALGMMG